MKKITALLGFLGVVSMFSACADTDTISTPDYFNEQANTGTSSAAGSTEPGVSSSTSSAPSGNGGVSSNSATRDTTIVRDTVRVEQPHKDYVAPYSSSGTFCWSAECNANQSTTPQPASSASVGTIEINMSSATPTPPLISGSQMIDQRDQKSYALKTVAGKLWMADNINYKTRNGYFCNLEGGEDMCATYGGFYTYAAAQGVCPDGWRLPTEAEFEAAIAEQEWKWWKFGGRFKLDGGELTEYGDDKKLGYLWVADSKYIQLKNYADDGTKEYEFHAISERGYNVRCVQE